MTSELFSVAGITTVVALLFTLVFQYVPKLRVFWGGVASEAKKAIVLALYVVTGAIVAFAGCIPALKELFPSFMCVETPAFINYFFGVLIAVGAGQGVFGILPELNDVADAKMARDIDTLEVFEDR